MVQIRWTDYALGDLKNIADYIALNSVKYAEIQTQRFLSSTGKLKHNPEFGHVVREINNPLIREILTGNYRIIYKIISPEQIDILTIHHNRRLLQNNPNFGRLK